MSKFIFVTGGVVSGLGKGITAASLGRLLKSRGFKVAAQKLDPYINIDPGTMNPCQHGEVFVTEDGAETDLDLGHYERFIDEDLNKFSNLTTGKVYWNVLNRERRGDYLGETIQVIPHITNEIKEFIYNASNKSEILITEIGGTIGDIESQPFLEAIRQIALEVGKQNCLFIHVTLVPYLKASNEHKSKPTQHSVKEMRALGLNPDIIVMRSDEPIEPSIRQKISLFCNVKSDCVIENQTISNLYEAPIMLEDQNFSEIVCRELALPLNEINIKEWEDMCMRAKQPSKKVKIGLVGKYIKLQDSYISVVESLKHAGVYNDAEVEIDWIEAEDITEDNMKILEGVDGILVPGGFGDRGIEGKILACKYARENNIPYFGICLGMQIAAIEYARNVLGYSDANSTEFDSNTKHAIIDFMPDQNDVLEKGGTMRLGSYPCSIKQGTIMEKAYGSLNITERHRHRYEFNNIFRNEFEEKGIVFAGTSPDQRLVEAIEIPANKFFIGVQYHPEFKSRPNKAHPIFREFIKASIN